MFYRLLCYLLHLIGAGQANDQLLHSILSENFPYNYFAHDSHYVDTLHLPTRVLSKPD